MTSVVLVRIAAVGVLLKIWFWSQRLLGSRGQLEGDIGDKIHQWLAPITRFLNDSKWAANALLISSSLGIDAMGLYVLYQGIFGPSFRPILGLTCLLVLRQLSQYLTALPSPPGMIWRYPGLPSLLVTYHVENDLFFSGHTALAIYGALTLGYLGGPAMVPVGIGLAIFEMFTVLSLRAHYTMDVYAGFVTALACFFAFQGWPGLL